MKTATLYINKRIDSANHRDSSRTQEMVSYKILLIVFVALFVVAFADEEARDKRGFFNGGYGRYGGYGGYGYPYGYHSLGYSGLGYPVLGYGYGLGNPFLHQIFPF
ncbi:unnamed protein product [Nezara viridula]|uniref:Uncharacterized protein n=1 Tax=Nezara viridula TaxID=85310 RepID=A0A9P0HHQ8_NEZVI|nr:unnamed protein product [Nezara viridula]